MVKAMKHHIALFCCSIYSNKILTRLTVINNIIKKSFLEENNLKILQVHLYGKCSLKKNCDKYNFKSPVDLLLETKRFEKRFF